MCINTLSQKYDKTVESAENTVKSSISGGLIYMIKVLFICHGNILTLIKNT